MPDPLCLCRHCGQKINAREPRWTGREPYESWHYICAGDAGLTSLTITDAIKIRQKLSETARLLAELDNIRFMIAVLENQLGVDRSAQITHRSRRLN